MTGTPRRSCELIRDTQNLVESCTSPIHRYDLPETGCEGCALLILQRRRAVPLADNETDPFNPPSEKRVTPKKAS